MAKYIIKNALMVIPTMLCVVFIIFTINYFTPGDPVAVFYDFDYTEEQYAEKAAEWGLDQPFFQQFVNYIKNIVTKLDFGYSYYSGKSVMSELTTRFPVSLKLGLISVALTVLIGVPFGIISATRQYSPLDYGVTFISLFFAAVPGFWLSMIMILIFSSRLGWLPSSGLTSWTCYIMPVIASSAQYIASITRQTRSSMLEVIRQDYIRTARAKGVSEGVVIRRHALRNALIPVVTLIGMQAGAVIAGSAIIEAVHSFPGMGSLMMTAINNKDYNTIQAVVLLLSGVVCLINLLVDIVYVWIDPRVNVR
ncbi:ABC transporter permease [Lawsonibacter celer]|uniref:ABC transporter permease n=1 Tax=Lawsonibacter celer TaxID=2986526 RepID=UPI001645C48E|nr:ABC transporter permease [Lawsonibacter celer]